MDVRVKEREDGMDGCADAWIDGCKCRWCRWVQVDGTNADDASADGASANGASADGADGCKYG